MAIANVKTTVPRNTIRPSELSPLVNLVLQSRQIVPRLLIRQIIHLIVLLLSHDAVVD